LEVSQWRAPFPPPEVIRGYNDAIPNGGERLLAQFEAEAAERRAFTRRKQTHEFIIALAGRISAIVFALAALSVSAYAIYLNREWAASVIGGSMIALVVAALIGSKLNWPRRGTDSG